MSRVLFSWVAEWHSRDEGRQPDLYKIKIKDVNVYGRKGHTSTGLSPGRS